MTHALVSRVSGTAVYGAASSAGADAGRDLARADIFDYIDAFYNRTRRHSHFGGISPESFELASS